MYFVFIYAFAFTVISSKRSIRAVTSNKARLWPDGTVPFVIDDTYNGDYKRLFQLAMNHWTKHTCVTFVRYDPSKHSDHILFTKDKCGCCSHVGRKGGGVQIISIGDRCDKFGIVVHELGHVIGFWHEHTRPDRDNFVQIFYSNIIPGQDYNFDKAKIDEIDSLHETYDFYSIMHYAKDTFSKAKGADTIVPKPHLITDQERSLIGQRIELSRGDVRQAKKLYHCPKCFTSYSSLHGTLITDNNCNDFVWRVMVPEGSRVKLHLNTFSLFGNVSNDCDDQSREILRIRNGLTMKSEVIKCICGREEHKLEVTVNGGGILIELRMSTKKTVTKLGHFQVNCGGLIEANYGYLESPKWPDEYSQGLKCLWVIRVTPGFRISVRFHYFQLEYHKDCIYDFLELSEKHSNQTAVLARLCGYSKPHSFTTNYSNELFIQFSSDMSIQKNGFQLEFVKEIDECISGAHKCQQICVNIVGGYNCECESGYRLNPDGFTCQESCGGVLNNITGVVVAPNYNTNVNCIWEIRAENGYQIYLTVHNYSVNNKNNNSACNNNYLEISLNDSKDSTQIFCGESNDDHQLQTFSRNVTIDFVSRAFTHNNFSITYEMDVDECYSNSSQCSHICVNLLRSYQCQCPQNLQLSSDNHTCELPECIHEINEVSGQITSFGYPEEYPRDWECSWHLMTTPGHRVKMTFADFDLEDHSDCKYDYLEVHDGGDKRNALMVARLCGQKVPPLMISSANELLLSMKTDNTGFNKGFQANFESICGGEMWAESSVGYIYSHTNFGDTFYGKDVKCHWEIRKPSGNKDSGEVTVIKLEFKHFELESDANCDYDHLIVNDFIDGNVTFLGKFCGNSVPDFIFSSGDKVILDFESDKTVEDKGFIVEYNLVSISENGVNQVPIKGTETS